MKHPADTAIRLGTRTDLRAINETFNHYVAHSIAVFEEEPVTMEERERWFERYGSDGPHRLLVADVDGGFAGFASGQAFRSPTRPLAPCTRSSASGASRSTTSTRSRTAAGSPRPGTGRRWGPRERRRREGSALMILTDHELREARPRFPVCTPADMQRARYRFPLLTAWDLAQARWRLAVAAPSPSRIRL